MKRLLVLFAIMALLLVPTMAMGASTGEALPSGATEVGHWELVNGAWVGDPSTGDGLIGSGNARCWKSGQAVTGDCNIAQYGPVTFTHHASVAQWCRLNITNTRWDWRVRKPGTYAADCITVQLASNNAIQLAFAGFGDLMYKETGEGIKQNIATWYALAGTLPAVDSSAWISASYFTERVVTIPDSQALHDGYDYKLYNKIFVDTCNSSCEYENKGTITITLTNIKDWIDGTTGTWKNPQV